MKPLLTCILTLLVLVSVSAFVSANVQQASVVAAVPQVAIAAIPQVAIAVAVPQVAVAVAAPVYTTRIGIISRLRAARVYRRSLANVRVNVQSATMVVAPTCVGLGE